jgi:hypothetical protein
MLFYGFIRSFPLPLDKLKFGGESVFLSTKAKPIAVAV